MSKLSIIIIFPLNWQLSTLSWHTEICSRHHLPLLCIFAIWLLLSYLSLCFLVFFALFFLFSFIYCILYLKFRHGLSLNFFYFKPYNYSFTYIPLCLCDACACDTHLIHCQNYFPGLKYVKTYSLFFFSLTFFQAKYLCSEY